MTRTALVLALFLPLACAGLARGTRSAQAEEASDKYTAAELKELVAPVALYPDVVLGSMLPASTVPNDVKAAADWVAAQGGKVDAVPEDKGWDKSVQAMLQYPDVLTWMKDNAGWMEQMAFAVAVQQSEVLKAVQDFRAEVQKAGNLTSNEYQTINVEDEGDTEVIVIEPTNPEVVYVPTYQPAAVAQPGYAGYGWGWGFAVGAATAWAFHEIAWGGSHGGEININNNVTNNVGNRNVSGNDIGPHRASQWNASGGAKRPAGGVKQPSARAATRPGGAGGAGRPGGVGGAGGVRPPSARPSRPSTQPGGLGGGKGPSKAPSLGGAGAGAGNRPGGGAGAPSRPATKPASKPTGGFSGAGQSGAQARAQSQRGGSSLKASSGGSSYKGHSRGSSGGGSARGSGGGRGGGGGGRRR